MIRAFFDDRISVEDGKIVRVVTASWKKSRRHDEGTTEVYKIYDDGSEFCKHLVFSMYSGYLVDDRYLSEEEWDEPAFNLKAFRESYSDDITDSEKESMISVYPEFKWTLQKLGASSRALAMNLLVAWKKNPKVELLVAAKLFNIYLDGNFARMSTVKQKMVLGFIRENPCAKYWPLQKINFVMNRKGTESDYETWHSYRDRNGKLVCYKWFKKYRDGLFNDCGSNYAVIDFYRDYLQMASAVGHDIRDDYWRYPKDIKKAHDKVQKEYDAMMEAKRIEEKKTANRRERNKKKNYEKVVSQFVKSTIRKNGLVVHIPKDLKEIRKQANSLHQCLVRMDYYGMMAERELLLVFISDRDGNPVATAEIMPNLKIGQFYADQRTNDFEQMKPSDKAKDALNIWLEKFSKTVMDNFKHVA